MIISEKYFENDFTESQVKIIIARIDQAFNENGAVVYGKAFKDGELRGLTTTKTDSCTHVGLCLGFKPMGIATPINKAHMGHNDLDHAHVKNLEEQLAQAKLKLKNMGVE